MAGEKYITIKELAELKNISARAIRLSRGKYITRDVVVKGGKSFEILLSSIEPELQEKYYNTFLKLRVLNISLRRRHSEDLPIGIKPIILINGHCCVMAKSFKRRSGSSY